MLDRPLAFLDLETTGAMAGRDRITEIGLILVEADGSSREWSSLVNPQQPIPPFISQLTGIDDALVANAPTFTELAAELAGLLAGRLLIAHNAYFDYGFLKAAYADLQLPFLSQTLCTVRLSRKLFPQYHKHGLDALVERFALTVGERHRALADTRLLWQFWRLLPQQLGEAAVQQAVAELLRPPPLPAGLDASCLEDLPESPGLYRLLAADGSVLDLAAATHLRREVWQRLRRESAGGRFNKLIARVDWQGALSAFGAALLTSLQQGQNRPCLSWRQGDDGLALQLIDLRQGGDTVDQHCFGLYASEKEARRALLKLAERNRLCLIALGLESTGKRSLQPCSAVALHRCHGWCCGRETQESYRPRQQQALAKLQLPNWPWPGAVLLEERDASGLHQVWHRFDRWRYQGRYEQQAAASAPAPSPIFNGSVFKLLRETLPQAQVLPLSPESD